MKSLDLGMIRDYVNKNIEKFHNSRVSSLEQLRLSKLLQKNPYLFKAKNVKTANEIVTGFLNVFLSSSEEKFFGDFLEGLAI
ncbi:cytosolic protein, partial [bacterium]|nr:cytosolic protein [bacterium]